MDNDRSLIGLTSTVWFALAIAYATIPELNMPRSARLWAVGGLVFAAIWLAMLWTKRRRASPTPADPAKE